MKIEHKQDTYHSISLSESQNDDGDSWAFVVNSGAGYKDKQNAKRKTLSLLVKMQEAITQCRTELENF